MRRAIESQRATVQALYDATKGQDATPEQAQFLAPLLSTAQDLFTELEHVFSFAETRGLIR